MIDEGYTKYRVDWQLDDPVPAEEVAALDAWRRRLYAAGLVGHDPEHDVGYGNISVRAGDGFIISGTRTGHIVETDARHYSRVTDYSIDDNVVTCRGPVQASSEALTHAAIYELDAAIGAVVHVHSRPLWTTCKGVLPTTGASIPYGTPDMAREFQRLYRETALAADGVAVMAGHDDGIIAFGRDIEEGAERILALTP
ncbi:class II aldolase/adducin family protein [Wenzhouxiangella sp. XN79A]|uniref:class II aldolase/adducin family protein n=1 Tax=Wenzhouxiangella sp. XN79A TaxID=2724193 RepID=UPI00144A87BA|nr:class II aldolase/adducin family protein [Wenzhouxiangella sp. XN79A]NKI36616.1 class II aldolase/adducin family protein [Wenzhouxiangella sp. XN79A]